MLELTLTARERLIDGFRVGRALPAPERRLVGPFIFFDHIGPAVLAPGQALDVRPHPHINLATVTYLFEGEILHRDSLGSQQVIAPGAINWMTAGRGIVHSERTPQPLRATGSRMHGLQLWVALPTQHEETAPAFHHHAADTLPIVDDDGIILRVLAGAAYGATSPVQTLSPLFYVEATVPAGAQLVLPPEYAERAAYVVEGQVTCADATFAPGQMLIFTLHSTPVLRATVPSRVILLGGEPLDGPRHIWWNFVSSRPERIEAAKNDWRQGRFGKVPGDEKEFIPLPDR